MAVDNMHISTLEQFQRNSEHTQPTTKQSLCLRRILSHSNSQMHDWMSDIFLGPHVRTTQKARAAISYPAALGITHQHMQAAMKVLDAWNLSDCVFLLSEDATAQQLRADVMSIGKDILIYGLNGPTVVIHTAEEYQKAVNEGLAYATMLYVYTLVPLVKGAPYLPLFAFSHDNSSNIFTTGLMLTIMQWWQEVTPMCSKP